MIYQSVSEAIGHTPMFRLSRIEQLYQCKACILAKLESFNPAGSSKDRAALQMILDAEKCGRLHRDATIIEPTSGNTGIALAAIAAERGYRAIFTMPETMSRERQLLLKAYGAQIVLTDGALGMQGAIQKAQELSSEIEGAFLPDQFSNESNVNAHYRSTGPEIWKDTEGFIDYLIAAVGTGGTITGTGRYLKEMKNGVKIVAVEPTNSAVLSGKQAGPHGIQGIGAGFIPPILDTDLLDRILTVSEDEAYQAAQALAKSEGLLVGISSGAALSCAIDIAKKEENTGKTIVVIFPDTGERYLSTPLFESP